MFEIIRSKGIEKVKIDVTMKKGNYQTIVENKPLRKMKRGRMRVDATKRNMDQNESSDEEFRLDIPKEYQVYLRGVAKAADMSLNEFILQATEEKCENVAEELPPYLIPNLFTWLKEHGNSDEDIVDCIRYIAEETAELTYESESNAADGEINRVPVEDIP